MRLQGLGDELLFDEMSASCEIIFLTTLVNLEAFELPTRLPKIYTSETLKAQLLLYFKSLGKELNSENVYVFKPFKAERLELSGGNALEVLPCVPSDASTSFMLAFRKGLRITHFYAGFASDIYTTLIDSTFGKWLRASGGSIDNLYIMNHSSTERCVDCEFKSAFENLKQQLEDENIAKMLVRVPLFGCEVFITHLASEYRGEVAIDGSIYEIFSKTPEAEMKHFINDFKNSTIVLSDTDLPLESNCSNEITVQKYDVKWSPLPGILELDSLTRFLHPKNISYISDINSYKIMQTPIVYITKYAYKNKTLTVNESNENDNEISTKKCCCYETLVSHTHYTHCINNLVLESTNAYYHDDIIESASNSDNETSGQTSITQTRPHQKTQQSSATKKKRTKTNAAKNMNSSPIKANECNKESNLPNLLTSNQKKIIHGPITNNLIYRKGKRGVHFEDDSSSS